MRNDEEKERREREYEEQRGEREKRRETLSLRMGVADAHLSVGFV